MVSRLALVALARSLLSLTPPLSDSQFVKLCRILARPDLPTSPLYSSNILRVTNRSTLVPLLTETLSAHTTAEWLEKMRGGGFPFAPVNNIRQTFEHPQAVARGVVTEVEHPRAGRIKLLAPAVSYNNEKMKVRYTRLHCARAAPIS